MQVALSNGQTAEFADNLDHISNDERDELSYVVDETEGSALRKNKALNRLLIAYGVQSWTLEEPLPSEDIAVLGRISGADGKVLELAAWKLRFTSEAAGEPRPDEATPGSGPT